MKYNFAAHFLFEKRRFWTKIRDFAAHFFFEKRRFWTKIRDVGRKYAILRLTSYLKSDDFGRKYAILRLTSYLKSNDFGRKYAILDENTRFCGSLLIKKATCRAGRMVRVAVAARAVFQFPRLWSAAFQIQLFWNATARLGSVASRQRAPMRSRNYLLHIVDAIVSHLSFNQPHVSLRDRAFLRSTALAHMTILPLEQRRP